MAGFESNILRFFSGTGRSCREDGCLLHTTRFMGLRCILFLAFFMACVFLLSGTAAGDARAAAEPAVRSAAEIDYPPFSVVDEHGYATGFSVELLRAALAAMDRDVTFKTGPWAQVRGWLEQGDIQALPLVGRTPERELLFDFTFPYMTLHGAIVVRKGTSGITDVKDLKGKQVAVMKGDNAEEFLRRKDRGIDIVTRPTFETALRELADGSHDAVFIQRLVALRLIQENGISGLDVSENDTLIPEGRGETILIVEDEITILEIAQKMLEIIGYQVLVAPSAELALELAKAHGADIRLLISDVIMPEMNGRDLADRIQAFCPNLKILFMSGYTADVIAHRGVLDAGVHFIQKPFSRSDLARKVRHTLDF